MRKLLALFAAVAVLAFGAASLANAQSVVTNTTDQLFNAVDEVSSSLTVSAGTTISTFISGTYAAGNTVVLQRELGSPGSGAWEAVQTVTTGTANARITNSWVSGTGTESFRLIMTATGTGDVVAYLTDWSTTARTWTTNASQIVLFDDFTGINSASTTVLNASRYVTQNSDTGGGTVAAMDVAIQEGAITLDGGSTADNGVCISSITAASMGALVSDGTMSFEVRLRSGALDGKIAVLLANTACIADTVPVVDIDSGVVSQVDGGSESLAGFVRQDEATDTDDWQAISAIADAEGANALEVVLGTATAINTYVTLRVEIAAAGDAYWYIDGVLVHAEPLAVTTTARLIPNVFVMETAPNVGAVIVFIDYWEFVQARPSS